MRHFCDQNGYLALIKSMDIGVIKGATKQYSEELAEIPAFKDKLRLTSQWIIKSCFKMLGRTYR